MVPRALSRVLAVPAALAAIVACSGAEDPGLGPGPGSPNPPPPGSINVEPNEPPSKDDAGRDVNPDASGVTDSGGRDSSARDAAAETGGRDAGGRDAHT